MKALTQILTIHMLSPHTQKKDEFWKQVLVGITCNMHVVIWVHVVLAFDRIFLMT